VGEQEEAEGMSEQAKPSDPRTNTGQHEQIIADASKTIVAGATAMAAACLDEAMVKLRDKPHDPLHAEKFIHLADRLTEIAARCYDIGERSRETAYKLYGLPNDGRIPDKEAAA
jgi:hypothetical protein